MTMIRQFNPPTVESFLTRKNNLNDPLDFFHFV
jgi:hypothetical protein